MQVQCVRDIFNFCIHMYNITGGVVVNKFCSFLCKRNIPILSILRCIMKYGSVCGGGRGCEERQTKNLKEMRSMAVLSGVII